MPLVFKLRILGDTMTKEEIQLIVREELSGILEEARGRAVSIRGDQDKIGEQVIDIFIRTIGERAQRQTSPSQIE
jgi:hypothetical protein